MDELRQLRQAFDQLADANNWHPNHTPKNLAITISVETAELLEIFQWLGGEKSNKLTIEQHQWVGDEIANVFLYLLCLSDRLNIGLVKVARGKMEKNKQRLNQ